MNESISIEIKDGVSGTIAQKLKGIATDAREAYSAVNLLDKSIGSLSTYSLTNATSALNSAAAAQQNLAAVQAKVSAATNAHNEAQARLTSSLNMVQTSATSLSNSIGLLVSVTNKLTTSAQSAGKATRQQGDDVASLLGKIDPTVAALGRLDDMEKQLAAFRKTNKIDTETYTQYSQKITEARTALGGFDESSKKATMSAKQLRQATLYLPAQFGDLARQIAAGGSPMMAIFQQGSQLTNMFGGLGNALKATGSFLVSMVNPWTIAAALIGAIGVAAAVAEGRLRTLNSQLAEFRGTGRGGEIDAGFVTNLRKELQLLPDVGRTAANEIIKSFADVRGVGAANITAATKVVSDLGYALGTTTPKAAETLAKALDDPLKGAIELDKQLGFLTVQNFKTIESLTKAGKTAQAQKVLIDLLSKSIGGLANDSLTPLQRATNNFGNAWDKLMESMSNGSPLQSVVNGLSNIVNGLTWVINKLNDLHNVKPPAWVQAMLDSKYSINNMVGVGGFFGAKNQDSTATAAASTVSPSGAQYGQTTKYKTDKAGITDKKGAAAAESRATALAKLNAQLDNQFKLLNMVGDEHDREEMYDRINEGFIGRKIKLTAQETAAIKEKIASIVDSNEYSKEANRIYEEAVSPLRTYVNAQAAAKDLLDQGKISQAAYSKEITKSFETYSNINAPLREFNIQLDQQLTLAKLLTGQREIESAVQTQANSLLAKGIVLSTEEADKLRERLKLQQQVTQVQNEVQAIYDSSVGALTAIIAKTEALNIAQQKGMISNDSYSASLGQLALQAADLKLKMPDATFGDAMLVGLGKVTAGFEGILPGLSTSFGNFFTSFSDGFADSVGKAVVESENLGEALRNVAKNAVSSLISALIKLGIQYAVNAALGTTVGAASTAASTALAATTAAAWAPAAAMVSSATFGANSVPAAAGLTATSALASALASIPGFESGGYTGNGGTSQMAGVVHGKEFVVNANATAQNRQMLEAMNAGRKVQGVNFGGSGGSGRNGGVKVTVANYGTPQTYETQSVSRDEIRLIATDVVSREAPKVIANEHNNFNSVVSKSTRRNLKVEPNRAG